MPTCLPPSPTDAEPARHACRRGYPGRRTATIRRLCAVAFVALHAAGANAGALEQPVSLRTEADLLRAVSVTLQQAVAASERYRGNEPRLRRFARNEVSARRKPIEQLNRWGGVPPRSSRPFAIAPDDDAGYLRAMLRNHAWLIELIEYGEGLPLSGHVRRLMKALSRDAASEFAQLSRLEKR